MVPVRALFRTALAGLLLCFAATAPARPTAPVLAHPVVVGKLGPFATARVEIAAVEPETGNGFTTRVVAGGRSYALASPDEPLDFFDVHVRAVMFANADRKPGNELIILYVSRQRGPQTEVDRLACVYHWTGDGWARLPKIEARLAGSRDAAAVRARLTGRRS